ncbi:MAG: amino acid adenylation domain-containing protein [Anaerolineales bacterium]|nr:amino acid adenylation domain-containing protein [Anaerolineales bacterium]
MSKVNENQSGWEQLPPDKRALIEQRLKKGQERTTFPTKIGRRSDPNRAPLSFAQERLWFLDQLEPQNTIYNRPWVLLLIGELDIPKLHQCVNNLVSRHESLRTTFSHENGIPFQVIRPFEAINIPLIDLSTYSEAERAARANEWIIQDAHTPFDLKNDLLFRPSIVKMQEDRHLLLLTTHHIVFDGWSERVLFSELTQLYEALQRQETSPLPEPELQYADYSEWQRKYLTDDTLAELSTFWQDELADAPPLLQLKLDHPRPAYQTYNGARLAFTLSASLAEGLKEWSKQEDATLFMTLLTAFYVVLYLNSGQSDLLIGTSIAGRNRVELEDVIGFFVNTLVLRANLDGDPSIRDLQRRVREITLRSYEYQDMPFEKLVEVINPPRSLNQNPIVQVTFSLRNLPKYELGMSDLDTENFKHDAVNIKFDLSMEISEVEQCLLCKFAYNADLFDRSSIQRMADQFSEVLEIILQDPDTPLSRLQDYSIALIPRTSMFTILTLEEFATASNLTGTQRMIWAGSKLRPAVPLFNLAYTFNFKKELNSKRFREAFQLLIDHSDALRTTIYEVDGIPQQRVLEQLSFDLEVIDFSHEKNPSEAVNEWVEGRSRTNLRLSKQLFDTALLKLSDGEWAWYLNLHHIIVDNLSVELIFNYLQEIYSGLSEDENADRFSLPQFQDYIEFERAYRYSEEYRVAASYWNQKFSTKLEPLGLYGDPMPQRSTQITRQSLNLGIARTDRLKQLSLNEGFFHKSAHASLHNMLIAILAAYLYRVSGTRDIGIATSFHNRSTSEQKATIGLFMEILPYRISIDEGETFHSLIRKVNMEGSETLKHRHFPFQNPRHEKAYDVALNYHVPTFKTFLDAPVTFMRHHTGHEEDVMTIHVHDYSAIGSLTFNFDLNCDVFDEENRNRVIDHFEEVVDGILKKPYAPLDNIDLLTPSEKQKVIFDFNDTQVDFPQRATIHQLFEDQVKKTAQHVALISGDQSISYEQLNNRANQVAHYLRSKGVGPDTIVGIYLYRSIEMMIGILGILKAGGAYLPFDPDLPVDRLNSMVSDARAAILLTQENLKDNLTNDQAEVIALDSQWEVFSDESEANLDPAAEPDNLAYIIYTSGSTGKPKGVLVEHRSLVNFAEWAKRDWKLGPGDRVLQFASIGWDTSVEEIFPTLASGATLVLRPPGMIDSYERFLDKCRSLELSVLSLPTAFWHDLTEAIVHDDLSIPPRIRLVNFGGEKPSRHRVFQWQEHVRSNIRLVNTYGLTEATAITTQFDILQPDSQHLLHSVVPIGTPISNVQAYILDSESRVVPIGIPGELCVGGVGLARGYLNRPELTTEKFTPNHLPGTPGDMIFRTGDLARHLHDGSIEFIGRKDRQVKVRGYRIELGEIEASLLQHSGVRDVVVLAYDEKDDNGEGQVRSKFLAAYILAQPDYSPDLSASELRAHLRDSLPEFMIPATFTFMETFPLTPSGKIDRLALPFPEEWGTDVTRPYTAPRDTLERELTKVWEDTLGIHPIGVQDNFFELGGHSLLAVRLFAAIEKQSGKTLPLITMFESPTIAGQAELFRETKRTEEIISIVPISEDGSNPPVFCVSPSVIDVITYHELSMHLGDEQPFYAIYSPLIGDWNSGKERLEPIASRLLAQIRERFPQSPYYLGGYSAGGMVAFEMAQQLYRSGEGVGLLVLLDTFGTDYPKLLPWVTPWLFNAFRVIRRIQTYIWKFWILDRKGKLDYLRFRPIQTWLQNRYGEISRPPAYKGLDDKLYLTPGRQQYQPQPYKGKTVLIRAEKGLLGVKHDPTMGWEGILTGEFDVCLVPGDHESILFGPRIAQMGKLLQPYLEHDPSSDPSGLT